MNKYLMPICRAQLIGRVVKGFPLSTVLLLGFGFALANLIYLATSNPEDRTDRSMVSLAASIAILLGLLT